MEVPVPRILLLLALFFTAPLWAATLPGVPAATTDQSSSSEPDLAQKKALTEYETYKAKAIDELSEVEKQFIASIENANKQLKAINKTKK